MISFLLFLCWGSFLNVIAHRLVTPGTFLAIRSHCPACSHQLAWYDLIPVVSWILLLGRCRYCRTSISLLYPGVELLTAFLLTYALYHLPCDYFPAYALFISALIITIRSDLQTMLISRFVTIFLIPLGFVLSACGYLPITLSDSVGGTLIGGGFLWIIATLFSRIRGKEGIGQGDIDLLAFIGSFLGVVGCWLSLCIGALSGAIIGSFYTLIVAKYDQSARIPFGPFLAAGAIIVIFYGDTLMGYILP